MTALPQARAQPPVLRPEPAIRAARAEDLDRLLALENRCFEHDRLSRRSFRHFLSSDTASCLVTERDGELLASGSIELACIDLRDRGKGPIPLPRELRALLPTD